MKIVYVPELPQQVIIKTDKILLVGTGQKGVEPHERLCSEKGE